MKSDLTHAPARLYLSTAQLWREAGAADPLDAIEAALSWLAYVRLKKKAPAGSASELIAEQWVEISEEVSHELKLPPQDLKSRGYALRTPGLFEQTRRIADAAAPAIGGKAASEFMGALLSFLMHTPQIGMRRSEIGSFLWPAYLSHLFHALMGRPSGGPLYVPYDSSGWLPLVLARDGWSVECEVANEQTARIFALFGFLADWRVKVHVGDALRRPTLLDGSKLRQFHHSAAIVTFGLRLRDDTGADPHQRFPVRLLHGEARQIAHMVAQTTGRIAVIVPEGFLFRSAGGERDYKEHLVRRGILSAVIRLPRSAFSPNTNVQTSMLVLETGEIKERNVLFVDASELLGCGAGSGDPATAPDGAISRIAHLLESRGASEISSIADYDAIGAEGFNISVDRYVRSDEERQLAGVIESAPTVELGHIAEIIRPQSFPSEGADAIETFGEIALHDIEPDGQIKVPSKRVEVGERNIGKLLKQRLVQGDVLVSVRGRIGAVGMVGSIDVEEGCAGWLASQAFVIVRLRDTSPVSQLALYRYLSSPLGQAVLQSSATGVAVPMVSMGDMKKLRIIVPSKEEQREIEAQYDKIRELCEQIRKLETRTNELNATVWPMTRSDVNNSNNGVH